jgi:hypothetical protein
MRATEGDVEAAAKLLGVAPRTVRRWLRSEIGMAPSVYASLRQVLWLENEGVDLVALSERDGAALVALREHAQDGDEPVLDREGQPVLEGM